MAPWRRRPSAAVAPSAATSTRMAGRAFVCGLRLLPPLLLLLLVPCAVRSVGADERGCEFPAAWQGEWFLKGARDPVRIDRTSMSMRGRCLESHESKYLVSKDDCVRCLGISAKHANVLQYKETGCSQHTSHAAVCAEFTGDANLFSLFRLNGSAEACPLQGPLDFSYNQGAGDCGHPPSRLESCTEPSQLLLRFQACADVRGTESREEQLTCLASWKEGSVRYLVGRLVHAAAKTDADRLRCFAYERTDHGWQLAQSGDATCDALSGATEGSRTLRLWPPPPHGDGQAPPCVWPPWFSAGAWEPLGETGSPLRVLSAGTLQMGATQLRCVQALPDHRGGPHFRVQATHQCAIQHRCLGLVQRATHVVELLLGDCEAQQPARPLTLVQLRTLGGGGGCGSLLGRLFLLPPTGGGGGPLLQGCGGSSVLSSGCGGFHQDQLQLLLGCGSDTHRFQCHGSWEENGTRMVVASAVSSKRQYCIAVSAQRVAFAESPPACVQGLPWPWFSFNLTRTDSCGPEESAASACPWPAAGLLAAVLLLLLAPEPF